MFFEVVSLLVEAVRAGESGKDEHAALLPSPGTWLETLEANIKHLQ